MNDTPARDLSSAMAEPQQADGSPWSWAAYLGASWTWCIGMFLPVLLIRDYGPWAWVIFAIPNAVGAAAMGWVMRSREMSHDYTLRHASACRLFSFVTIAFQLFFSIWMLPLFLGPVGYVVVAVLVQSAFTPMTKLPWLRWGGVIVLAVSALVAAAMTTREMLHWPQALPIAPSEAAGLFLVCLAGFATCPYLDLTFHRARIATSDSGAKFAFGIGFGVLFASMIVLTFFYASGFSWFRRTNGVLLAVHWLVQMTYTVHVHAAELNRQATARDDTGVMRVSMGVWLAIGLVVGLAAVFGIDHNLDFHGRSIGEIGYRTFMSFYGLLFPIYVLMAIGGRRVFVPAWLVICVAASPFYGLAFLEGRMAWAIAGVAVVILGVLIARRFRPAAQASPTE